MSAGKLCALTVSVTCILLAMREAATASPVVVYDNTASFTKGSDYAWDGYWYAPDGFWPFNAFAATEPMGDQIRLAGTVRTVTEFDLVLSSVKPVTLPNLTFILYNIDSAILSFGDPLWTTSMSNVTVNGPTIISIPVPPFSSGYLSVNRRNTSRTASSARSPLKRR